MVLSSLTTSATDTYEALKEARDTVPTTFPRCTIETYYGNASRNDPREYNGKGVIWSCMQFQYEGDLEHDQVSGEGCMKWLNGYRVEGHFRNGVPNGKGRITWENGDVYEGEIVNGVRHGKGKLTSQKGRAVYEGCWHRGQRHGVGTQHYADGSVYRGVWANDAKHGCGTKRYQNGDCYDGMWCENKRHGQGSMGWKHDTECYTEVYDGNWKDGKPHGTGISTYVRALEALKDGEEEPTPTLYAPPVTSIINMYKGSFVEGRREGFGTFYYADGSSYEGMWVNNRKNGRGKWVNYNGDTSFCDYINDSPSEQSSPMNALSDFALVPEMYVNDMCGIPDGNCEQLTTTIKSLLLRFNTVLRSMFTSYGNAQDGIAFVFTSGDWWKHRLPSHISVPQFLRLLSDKNIIHGLVSVGTVIQCLAQVMDQEYDVISNMPNYDGSTDKREEIRKKLFRLDWSLNYRQFAEGIIRLAPEVCRGPGYYTVGEKFNHLVTQKLLVPQAVGRPLCCFSRDKSAVLEPLLPALEHKYNQLMNLKLESKVKLLEVRDFLLLVKPVLEKYNIKYLDAVVALFSSPHCVDDGQLPSGFNQPQSELTVSLFVKGCGVNDELLVSGLSVHKHVTLVDFVEALVILGQHISEKDSTFLLKDVLERELLPLPI